MASIEGFLPLRFDSEPSRKSGHPHLPVIHSTHSCPFTVPVLQDASPLHYPPTPSPGYGTSGAYGW